MVVARPDIPPSGPRYTGLRMSADEYLALPDDGHRYELIDGVVVMSPGPSPSHQDVRGEIEYKLRAFLRDHPVGWALADVDIVLSSDLIYRPDLVFVGSHRGQSRPRRIDFPPELVVEVLSPSNASTDLHTKRADYQRFGVPEYWIVSPGDGAILALTLDAGAYCERVLSGDAYGCPAIDGFTLDLAAVRATALG